MVYLWEPSIFANSDACVVGMEWAEWMTPAVPALTVAAARHSAKRRSA